MTKRIRSLWVGFVAVATTMAVFGTPAIVAGLTFNALDSRVLSRIDAGQAGPCRPLIARLIPSPPKSTDAAGPTIGQPTTVT